METFFFFWVLGAKRSQDCRDWKMEQIPLVEKSNPMSCCSDEQSHELLNKVPGQQYCFLSHLHCIYKMTPDSSDSASVCHTGGVHRWNDGNLPVQTHSKPDCNITDLFFIIWMAEYFQTLCLIMFSNIFFFFRFLKTSPLRWLWTEG